LPHTVQEDIKLQVRIFTSYTYRPDQGGRELRRVVVWRQALTGPSFTSNQLAQ